MTLARLRAMRSYRLSIAVLLAIASTVFAASNLTAAPIAVGVGAFGAGSTLTTFAGLAEGLEVNGVVIDGMLFQYSLGDGNLIINAGPGTTNNISEPNVVSVGDPSGILTITFPSFVDAFGYGYAVLAPAEVPAATTISLFNGAAP